MPRLFSVLTSAAIADDGTQWIEVIPVATEARNGKWFFTITREDLDTYAASIQANAGLIPIDYDHAAGDSTVAAGWFEGETQIVEANGQTPTAETQDHTSLWAKVKWTPQAAQEIRDGRFKRLSPEFDFHDRDAKTGLLTRAKEILASTLTNRPFFRQLAPLGSKGDVIWDSSSGFAWLQDQVSAAINPPGPDYRYWVMDVMAGAALIRESKTAVSWVAPIEVSDDGVTVAPASDWVEAKQEWVAASVAALDVNRAARPSNKELNMPDDLKVIATSLGLPEDATEDQITEAAKAAKTASDQLTTVKTELDELKAAAGDKSEVEKLREEFEAEKKVWMTKERDALLAKAVDDRRINPAAKDVLIEQFGTNVEGLEKVLATYDPKPVRAQGTGGPGKDAADLEPAEQDAAARFQQGDGAHTVVARDEEISAHVKAEKILADRGKHPGEYTSEEYVTAYAQAERELTVA